MSDLACLLIFLLTVFGVYCYMQLRTARIDLQRLQLRLALEHLDRLVDSTGKVIIDGPWTRQRGQTVEVWARTWDGKYRVRLGADGRIDAGWRTEE